MSKSTKTTTAKNPVDPVLVCHTCNDLIHYAMQYIGAGDSAELPLKLLLDECSRLTSEVIDAS